MCDINTLQQKIADLTNNGEIVIRFLAETVQGKTPAVQPCHRLEATSQLIRLGYPDRHSRASGNPVARDEESSLSSDNTARPEPVEGHTSSRHSRASGESRSADRADISYVK